MSIAKEGVKKIWLGELLALIAAVVVAVGTILMLTATTGGLVAGGSVVLVAGILAIVAFVFNLLGISKIRNENEKLKTAYILTVVGIFVSIFKGREGTLGNIATIAYSVIQILCIMYICQGIAMIHEQLNQYELVEKGNKTAKLAAILYAVGAIGSVLVTFLSSTTIGVVLALICVIAFLVIEIVAYFMYISFLKASKEAL